MRPCSRPCMHMGSSLLLKAIALAALQQGTGGTVTVGSCASSGVGAAQSAASALLQTGAAAAPINSRRAELKEAGGKNHESVFKIKYNDFNNTKFWSMAAFVFFFTFLIHHAKKRISESTEEDESLKVLVEQVFAEVMLFGVMAMSVFVSSQMVTLSMSTFHIFELAHLLISFAAFLLILAGVIFGNLRKVEDRYLKRIYKTSMVEVRRTIRQSDSIQDLPHELMDRAILELTRSQFFSQHRLDGDTFSWSIYLVESLRNNVGKLIEIKPLTWLALFLISAWVWILHMVFGEASWSLMSGPPANIGSYMIKLVLVNWICLAAQVLVALQAHRSVLQMKHMLGAADIEELRLALGVADPGVRVVDKTLGMRREWNLEVLTFRCKINFNALQVFAVLTAILLGFYFMHVLYNLIEFRMPWWWHLLFLVPPFVTFGLALPFVLVQYTHVQSFVEPDSDVIDCVLEAVGQAWQDLHFVQRQLEAKAKNQGIEDTGTTREYYEWAMKTCEEADRNASKSGMVDGAFSGGDFARALVHIGVHISKVRAKRLFKVLSHDKPLMKYEDFLDHVFAAHEEACAQTPKAFTILGSETELDMKSDEKKWKNGQA
mmetsp:Transcript_98463/g.180518  ORF Transcript_98463/g.180518 Transcript_98463/m.180518 type:complete len:603 (+) Transcript_98463:82-1890(+)